MEQFKQIMILLVLSILAVFFKHELLWLFHGIAYIYKHMASGLDHLVPSNAWVQLAVLSAILLIVPLVIAAAIGGLGCLFKKPFKFLFVPAAWISWVVVCVAVVLQGT